MTRAAWDERRLWFAAAVVYGVLAAELTFVWLWDPSWGRAELSAFVAEVFTGREGGIPVAAAAGVPPIVIFTVSVTQDLAAFFLTYPVFLWLLHRHHDAHNFVMRRVRRIEAAAHRHRAYADRWGPVGVFVFMLIPFLVNGPLVGGALGRLAGIPTRRLIVPVVASTVLAAAGWVFFFDQTIGRLEVVDPRVGYLVAGVILVGLVTAGVLGLVVEERRARTARAAASSPEPIDETESE
jgi:uncharacterized membrane protein